MNKIPQMILMGGGGFSMEPDNNRFEKYLLNLLDCHDPNVCFIPTASGESEDYISRFYKAFEAFPSVNASHISLFRDPPRNLHQCIMAQDLLYVGGGNTKSMLAVWQEWELPNLLRNAWQSGIVIAGISAGAICWFEWAFSDSLNQAQCHPLKGLGFLNGSACPHYDSETQRQADFVTAIQLGQIPAGYGIEDSCALHFKSTTLYQVIASEPNRSAYWIEPIREASRITHLPGKWLNPE